jgi:restriction system protein
MAFPKQHEVEMPLLRTLVELGGEAKPQSVYPHVTKQFKSLLTEEDLAARLPSSPSTFKWHNLVQWVRQRLVDRGDIDGATRGLWRISDQGRKRLLDSAGTKTRHKAELFEDVVNLRDLVDQHETEVKKRIVSDLKALRPSEFEQFCKSFLRLLGYQRLEVTNDGADGGIDGHGLFRQGVVTMRSAFQAKRWSDNPVGRPEIDRFRGAIQGAFDHGVYLTTSRFTRDAEAASIKSGAVPLLLLDGAAIAETMIRSGIGVISRPVMMHEIDASFFRFAGSEELL